MKKIIIIIMLAVAVVCPAQNTDNVPHNEFYAGAGFLNDNQLLSFTGDMLGTVLTLGQAVQMDRYWFITPSVGYRYWFNRKVGLGLHFAFDKNSVKALYRVNDITTNDDDEWRVHNRYFYTMAVDFSLNYMNKPACQLYGNIGFGATLVQFSDNTDPEARLKQFPYFNMHISPIGVRVGRTVAGFAEIGWGYKGFINAGISVKL
jgi:hypothetical protein